MWSISNFEKQFLFFLEYFSIILVKGPLIHLYIQSLTIFSAFNRWRLPGIWKHPYFFSLLFLNTRVYSKFCIITSAIQRDKSQSNNVSDMYCMHTCRYNTEYTIVVYQHCVFDVSFEYVLTRTLFKPIPHRICMCVCVPLDPIPETRQCVEWK